MKRFLTIVLVVSLVFAVNAAAIAASQTEPIKIGLSICSLISQFFEGVRQSAIDTAEELGVELVIANADGDAARQKEQILNLISAGAQVVLAIAQDSDAIVSSAADSAAAGIPFVALSRQPTDMQNVALFIGFSNEQSAGVDAEAMKQAAEDLGYGAVKVIQMVGDLNDTNAVERKSGFEAKAQELGFEIVAEVATEWNVETAFNRLRDTVQNVDDFNAIFAPSDILIPAIMSVLSARGEWVKYGEDGYKIITAIDGDPTAVAAVKEGYVYATANNDALELGREGVLRALDILRDGPPAQNIQKIDAIAVTKEIADSVGDSIWGNSFAN